MIRRFVRIPKRRTHKPCPPKAKRPDLTEYKNWLGAWPCWICFRNWCESKGIDFREACNNPEARSFYLAIQIFECGVTEVAHVGLRGLRQRCPDSECMPLGRKHHEHETAGGGPESHHTLGRRFWGYHNCTREEIFLMLHELYRRETGRDDV